MLHSRLTIVLLACSSFTLNAAAQITWNVTGFPTGDGANSVVTGDFDRDGKPDIATTASSANALMVFANRGGQHYVLTDQHAVSSPSQVETADVNGDGNLDLLATSADDKAVYVFLGVGDGTFLPGGSISLASPPRTIFLWDLDGDGALDLVVQEWDSTSSPTKSALLTFRNDGTGHFTPWHTVAAMSDKIGPAIGFADFNADGRPDIVVETATGVEFRLNNGNGRFAAPYSLNAGSRPEGLAIGSFNRDRYVDLVLALSAPCSGPPCASYATIFLNDGTGHFQSRRGRTLLTGSSMTVADITGDGAQDIVGLFTDHFLGQVNYVRGTGDGRFQAQTSIGHPDIGTMVVARDMDLDGRVDLWVPEFLPGGITLMTNQNAPVICAPPGSNSLQAKICSPVANSAVGRTLTVSGSGNSPAGVRRVELWIDGKKRAETPNDQLRASVTLNAGRHRVTVVAVDKYGASASASSYVTAK